MANRRFVTRSRKRVMSWQGQNIDTVNLTSGNPQFTTVISEAVLEQFPTPTLVRVRGRLLVLIDASSTSTNFGIVTMGMIVVTAAALAGSAVPSPLMDVGSDWLWWDVGTIGEGAPSTETGRIFGVDRIAVDSKAMRKIGLNQVVIFVAELTPCDSGTIVANICGNLRFLLKAP